MTTPDESNQLLTTVMRDDYQWPEHPELTAWRQAFRNAEVIYDRFGADGNLDADAYRNVLLRTMKRFGYEL
jgi:hypothetical protein